MIELYFETDSSRLPNASHNVIPVLLFKGSTGDTYASIGKAVLEELGDWKSNQMR